MISLKDLKQDLTAAKAERTMLLRRGESTDVIDAKISQLKAQIDASGATVAQVNAAGRFTKDNDQVTAGELDVRDADLARTISDAGSWTMQYPWC